MNFSASIDALVTTVNVGIVSFCDAANEHAFPILPRSTECAILKYHFRRENQ